VLQATTLAADSQRVTPELSLLSTERDPESAAVRIAECDETLSVIATGMAGLREELARLRTNAEELANDLSEREASLAEKDVALSSLEEEKELAERRADKASTELHEAELRIERQDEKIAALEQELATLGTRVADRERHLAQVEGEFSQARAILAERDRDPGPKQAVTGGIERKIVDWERRATNRPLELAAERDDDHAGSEASFTESVSRDGARMPPLVEEESAVGHVRFIALPDGYRLFESGDPCPRHGDHVEVDAKQFVVVRTGRSPLPRDSRRCAFLFPDPE
jgi:hypothetical protein